MKRIFRFLAVAASAVAIATPASATSATRTRLWSSPNPSQVGQAVQLRVEVDGLGGGAPAGTVALADDARALGSAVLSPYGAGQAAVAAGSAHSCALTAAGGVECWGWNQYGQLGDGTTQDRHSPVAVAGLSNGVVAISVGDVHSCALTVAGAVKCWGSNDRNQLGDGTSTRRSTPVAVSSLSSGVVAISAGGSHSCATTATGGVKCWGFNTSGQLGDGTTADRKRPVAVSGLSSGVVAIATGAVHSCALTSSFAVKCWGGNYRGQLGDGTATARSTPAPVASLSSGVAAIAAGGGHSCAVTHAGAARCWGSNDFGELGDGTTTERRRPVAVSGLSSGVVAITASFGHSCISTREGAAKCWGWNLFGQLGDGTATNRSSPVAVSGLSRGVVAIRAGNTHSCALTLGGGARCWGLNGSGAIGDGTTTGRLVPTPVSGFAGLARARALLTTRSLSVGAHTLRARYPGDAFHSASGGTRAHMVR